VIAVNSPAKEGNLEQIPPDELLASVQSTAAEAQQAQQVHEAKLAQAHGTAQQRAATAQNQMAQANNVVPITQGQGA
jgi:hypothetical protein